MIKLRSTTGCWTCRLRRKKCDEEQPICSTCATHDLTCFNGKEKPRWMDGRNNEKEQLEKIKNLVKKSAEEKRQRRASKLRQQRSLSVSQIEMPPKAPTQPPQTTTSSVNNQIASPTGSCGQAPWLLPPLDGEAYVELETALISPAINGPGESVHWIDFENTLPPLSEPAPLNSPKDERSLADIRPPRIDSFMNTCTEPSDPSPSAASANMTSYIEATTFGTPSLSESSTPYPDALRLVPQMSFAIEEANSIVYYLHHILPKQLPTYSIISGANKGWIYVLLSSSSMVRNATVSLSLRNRNSNRGQTTTTALVDPTQSHYHSMAVRELCQHLPVVSVREVQSFLEVLVTLVQLISYEVLAESYEGWTMHLRAASNMLPPSPAMAGALGSSLMENSVSDDFDFQRNPVAEVAQLLIGIVVFYDVLSSASLRIPHTIRNQQHLLDAWDIRIQDAFICETSVICLIADITELDTWKRTATRKERLSVMELGTRSTQLHERISQIIATISHELDSSLSRTAFELVRLHCSLIFASAAMTYLHVVVSGAYVSLPEIEESVAQTIERMIELPDYKWLEFLVWPFCMTGCMASEAQESFFSSIVAEAELEVDEMNSLAKALTVMEQCWHQRRKQMQPVDWVTAMESLDRKFILI